MMQELLRNEVTTPSVKMTSPQQTPHLQTPHLGNQILPIEDSAIHQIKRGVGTFPEATSNLKGSDFFKFSTDCIKFSFENILSRFHSVNNLIYTI